MLLNTNEYDFKIIEMIYCIQVNNLPFYFSPLCNCQQVNFRLGELKCFNFFFKYNCVLEKSRRGKPLHVNKVSKTTCGEIALYTVFIIFIVKVQFIRSKLRYNLWRMLSKSLPKRCNLLQGLLLLEKLLLFMSKRILGSKLRILCR